MKRIPINDPALGIFIDECLSLFTLFQGMSYIFPCPLSKYRIHGGNMTISKDLTYEKLFRETESSRAILKELRAYDCDPAVKKFYQLKVMLSELKFKEIQGKKK